jgi:hypothetical protein
MNLGCHALYLVGIYGIVFKDKMSEGPTFGWFFLPKYNANPIKLRKFPPIRVRWGMGMHWSMCSAGDSGMVKKIVMVLSYIRFRFLCSFC